MAKVKKTKKEYIAEGFGVGIALGVAFGVVFSNIGLGIALGVACGAALGNWRAKQAKATDENKDDAENE